MGRCSFDIARELAQGRNIVQNPESPSMGGDNKIVVLDDQIMHRRNGQVELEGLPRIAVVDGKEDAKFRASKEQAFFDWVFADRSNVGAVGNAVVDRRPALSEIM